MKLKDLLCNREKLRKYDELKEWKDYFTKNIIVKAGGEVDGRRYDYTVVNLPDNIKGIILSALDAEIKKLDEE